MNNKRLPIIIVVIIAFLVLTTLSSSLFYTIEATERGVLFYPFGMGLNKEDIVVPGMHLKAPWNDVYVYDVNEMSMTEQMDVLDKNGLSIRVDIGLRFYPIPDRIGYIHENFSRDYVNILVNPECRSTVRQVMGRYTAEEIYSTKRAEVEKTIQMETEEILGANNIKATAVLIRSIVLPQQIKAAIENKLQQEQEALAYQFRLDKERSEAERKKIAAEGESRANLIINNSLTNNLLKMRGIEATLELSKSPNTKVIIVGSQKNGLPIILGDN